MGSEGSCDYLAESRQSNIAMASSVVDAAGERETAAAAEKVEGAVGARRIVVDVVPGVAARFVAIAAVADGSHLDPSARYSAPSSKWTRRSPPLSLQRVRAPCTEGHRPAVSPVVWSARS
jgi:hypothetical protein